MVFHDAVGVISCASGRSVRAWMSKLNRVTAPDFHILTEGLVADLFSRASS